METEQYYLSDEELKIKQSIVLRSKLGAPTAPPV